MISHLLFPSAVRLATYALVRRSEPILTTQTMCSARLASRLPPRLSRWRTTLPEDASTGETLQRLAKEASLLSLSGLSPARTSRVAAWLCRPPARRRVRVPLAPLAARVAHPTPRSLRRVPGSGGPPTSVRLAAASTSSGSPPGRKRAATATSSPLGNARKRRRSSSGAVTSVALKQVCRLHAGLHRQRRAPLSARTISTRPSPLLGTPAVSPAKTALAARSASMGSDLPRRGR